MNKNSFLTKIIVLFFLLVSCKNSEQSSLNSNSQVFTPQDEELIIDEIKRYEEIVRNGEFDSIKLIFTEDIVFIRPGNQNITGIDSLFKIHYSNVPSIPGFWKKAEEIGGSGQIAYAYGFYGFSEGVPNGKFLEIREKQADGSWPVSRLIWNELLQE